MDKKEVAYNLFSQRVSLEHIAELINTPLATLKRWSTQGEWKKNRSSDASVKESATQRLWDLVDYQLSVIERIKAAKLELLGTASPDALTGLLIHRGDIDALHKLFSAIKKDDIQWDDSVRIIREFVEQVAQQDPSLAKKLAPLATQYIAKKRPCP